MSSWICSKVSMRRTCGSLKASCCGRSILFLNRFKRRKILMIFLSNVFRRRGILFVMLAMLCLGLFGGGLVHAQEMAGDAAVTVAPDQPATIIVTPSASNG